MTDLNTADTNDVTPEGNEAGNNVNDTRFDKIVKTARALGRDTAIGADALPKLLLEVVRASKDGAIDLEADKKAMHAIYGAYWDQRVKKGVHSQGKEGRAAQVSKLKRGYDLGQIKDFDPESSWIG
jgi:hypothetical protein